MRATCSTARIWLRRLVLWPRLTSADRSPLREARSPAKQRFVSWNCKRRSASEAAAKKLLTAKVAKVSHERKEIKNLKPQRTRRIFAEIAEKSGPVMYLTGIFLKKSAQKAREDH